MTETIPEGPTDPRFSARQDDSGTTVVQPAYGSPFSRPPIVPPVPGPPGPVGSPIAPVTEQLGSDYPSGRIYTSEHPIVPPAPEVGGDRGKTTIADDVVERVIKKIVDLTVDEVAGVDGLVADGEAGSVAVRLEGDQVEIDVTIRVEFGHVVHQVVEKTRASIIGQTERLLGLNVTDVNVTVADVVFAAPEESTPDE
jgi:uncharacterized alkaline shock family protein YloU